MLTLDQKLAHHQMRLVPDFTYDKMQRDGAQWMRCYDYGLTQVVYYGDYKTELNEKWESPTTHMDEAGLKAHRKKVKQAMEEMGREREEEMVRISLECETAWPGKIDRGTTEYLARKKIDSLYGCKIEMNDHGPFLLVPARDCRGKLWNWQRVYNTKFEQGDKFFLRGAKIEGLFHCLTQFYPEGIFYVCEGFATAATIAMATGSSATVIAAFNAGNLLPVSLALRAQYPRAQFVFCADDDQWVTRPDGSKYNPGLSHAHAASEKVGGAVMSPRFTDLSTRPTDWNDLYVLEGLSAVKEQLTNPTPRSDTQGPPPNGQEAGLVNDVLSEFEGIICKHEQDIFIYRDTHWHHMDKNVAADYFKRRIDTASGGRLKYKDIVSAYSRLLMHIPCLPEDTDLFSPQPQCINVLNGTLHILKQKGHFSLEFGPHSKKDYLVNCMPHRYDPEDEHTNAQLEEVLDKVFYDDVDIAEKKAGIQEMYGSAICGQFPMLHMLYGVPGTGKSTVANIVKRLVGQKNTCQVPPTRWNEFNMWSMIRKQVNIDTDIPTQGKIQDDMIKKVIEHGTVQIRRKNLSDVTTRLPSCNIFGANKLPPFVDGETRAQDRRWLLFEFGRVVIPKEMYDVTIWDAIYESDPQGVFNFAMAGVKRLIAQRGLFTVSQSGRAKVQAWQEESNEAGKAVKDFLEDVRNGEAADDKNTTVILHHEARIEPKKLWEVFKLTHVGNSLKYGGPQKHDFYEAIQRAGYSRCKIKGVWYFRGIGVREAGLGNI